MNNLILYITEDGQSRIQLRADLGTVWLSQLEMAELFQTSKQNVAKHLKAIFDEQELSLDSVVNQRLTTAADGKNYRVSHYNLDAILAVGAFGSRTSSRSSAPTVFLYSHTPAR